LEEFLSCIEKQDTQCLKSILSTKDKRKKEDGHIIKDYRYRYREISKEGHTILHYAMIFGDKKVVTKLLDLGAGKWVHVLL